MVGSYVDDYVPEAEVGVVCIVGSSCGPSVSDTIVMEVKERIDRDLTKEEHDKLDEWNGDLADEFMSAVNDRLDCEKLGCDAAFASYDDNCLIVVMVKGEAK